MSDNDWQNCPCEGCARRRKNSQRSAAAAWVFGNIYFASFSMISWLDVVGAADFEGSWLFSAIAFSLCWVIVLGVGAMWAYHAQGRQHAREGRTEAA